MKRAGIIALLLLACHREAPPQPSAPRRVVIKTVPTDARNAKVNALLPVAPPTFLDSARLGAKLGADGRVAEETATFRKGELVYLTLDLRESPVGQYVLQVCRTLSCALAGAERVTEALSEKLGLKVGETDASGMFTLMEFECLGACDRAPVVMVNNEHWHEKATPESCNQLVDDLKARGLSALSGCHLHVEK